MHFIGLSITTSGFIGVLGSGVLGVTRSLPAALFVHGILLSAFVVTYILRSGGVAKALETRVDSSYSIHPLWITILASLFVIAGCYIVVFMASGQPPEDMTRGEQVYFGMTFASIGGGVALITFSDWMSLKHRKRARRRR